jgi:thioredoxin 1
LSTAGTDLQPGKKFPHPKLAGYTGGMNPSIRSIFIVLTIALCCLVARGDTIQLTSGGPVTATVVKYANNTFEARGADGKTVNYSASSVRQITFDDGASPAQLKTRTNGIQEGKPVTFANGGFTLSTSSGNRQFPLIFVDRADFIAPKGQEVEVISHGAQVDIAKHLSAGNITIVDFYADWCGPCKQISPALEQMAKSDPGIALRKIDIVNWTTPVVKQYNVHSIPQVNVYGRSGKLIGTVLGADSKQVERYVAQAKSSG